MRKLLLPILLAFTIAGCSTSNGDADRHKYMAVMKATEAANKPLFQMECPKDGCIIKNLTVNNPNPKMPHIPKDTNGWDFANKIVDAATSVAPWLVVGKIASDGIKNAGGNTTYNGSHNSSTTNNSNASVNNSHNDSSSSSVDSSSTDFASDSSSTETHTSTNTSIADSYNPAETNNITYEAESPAVDNPEPVLEVDPGTE